MIASPLIVRLKRDKAMADRLYEELMHTEDSRMRVGFYSIFKSAGVKTAELRDWREHQHDHLGEYGHDIVVNRDRQLIVTMQ